MKLKEQVGTSGHVSGLYSSDTEFETQSIYREALLYRAL
jgi:hypothetical protein